MPSATLGGASPARYDTEHHCIVAESADGHKFSVTASPILWVGVLARHLVNGQINIRWVEDHVTREGETRYTMVDRVYTDTGNLVFEHEGYSGPDLDVAINAVRIIRPDSQANQLEIERRKRAKVQATFAAMPTKQPVAV